MAGGNVTVSTRNSCRDPERVEFTEEQILESIIPGRCPPQFNFKPAAIIHLLPTLLPDCGLW